MATTEERRAQLQAELARLDNEGREERIAGQMEDVSIGDVLSHLVQHSSGYPTNEDREVHARVVRKHYKRDEYAEDDDPEDQAGEDQALYTKDQAATGREDPGQPVPSAVPSGHVAE